MTGKRIVFTGGSGKAGRHAVPHLVAHGYDVLNVDLKPFDFAGGVPTLIADLTDSGQAFNALTVHHGFSGFEIGRAAGAAGRGRPFRRRAAGADRARQRHLHEERRQHLQRHRGGDETRRAQGRRSPRARRPTASASPRATRTSGRFRSRRTTTSIRWTPTASPRSATRRPPAPSPCAIEADIYALRIGNVIEPHEYGLFKGFLADPPSRKRCAWSYIDARDLGEIVRLCLEKDGLGFQVFNATNDTITLNTPTREALRTLAPIRRSRARWASTRRRCRTARRARCWASAKRTTGGSIVDAASGAADRASRPPRLRAASSARRSPGPPARSGAGSGRAGRSAPRPRSRARSPAGRG